MENKMRKNNKGFIEQLSVLNREVIASLRLTDDLLEELNEEEK